MKELLGFAVLTGPLWLILILLPVSIWIAVIVAKRFRHRSIRYAGGIGIFLLLFCLPFADEIAGRIYLNHLCDTETGMKVYLTVELPAEYWDAKGNAKFLNSRGVLIGAMLSNRFKWHNVSEPYTKSFIEMYKDRWVLQDNQTKKDLGEKITFVRHFGWLNRFSPASTIGESCRNVYAEKYGQEALFHKENTEDRDFLLKIFTPPVSSM